jgi:predicted phage terminase large subunit-like protein
MPGLKITPEEALAERARREQARRSLIPFAEYIAPWYQTGAHHRLVAEKLEQVELYIETKGKEGIGRLIISEPPRHGKTEEVSRIFPAWLLGKLPDSRVIVTSYGADLAQDDSRAIREYVTGDRYQALFGQQSAVDDAVDLAADARARANWNLAAPHRGGVVAAGVGGGITGKGAHLLIVDDPFKNRDEAESEAYRKRVISWWKSSAYTRLEDGAAVVITHTRWNRDDLAGYLMQQMVQDPLLADQYEVLYLPAVALQEDEYCRDEAEHQKNLERGIYIPAADPLGRKPGEALWPQKFNEMALAKIQANILDFEFTCLYQQMPRPQSGGFFDEENFQIIDRAPEGLQWVRYVDLALGETKQADWNATVATALDAATGNVYYRDMLLVHELDKFEHELAALMTDSSERGTVWGIEKVAFQAVVVRELLKKPKLANTAIMAIQPDGDKVQRARPLQLRARQGKVFLVRGPWTQKFINECLGFPSGRHDDQVDTASGGLQMIARKALRRQGKIKSYSWAGAVA